MTIRLNKKAGFYSGDSVILIFDKYKKPFYVNRNKTGLIHFNLPPGEYYTKNNLNPAPVREYKLPDLPPGNGHRKMPDKFTAHFANNPDKCSIFWNKGVIVFDQAFRNYPAFILEYILEHEKGHYKYFGQGQRSEQNCDKYAEREMLIKGYNPEQIRQAINLTLSNSPQGQMRKQLILNSLIKTF